MPVKKILLFLILMLIVLSVFPVANLSAGEPLTYYAADISRPVKVGFYENSPKIFTDNDGHASGFWADIVNHIAESEGWQIEWVHGSWEECLAKLENGEIDIMPDVTFTEQRAQLYAFSGEALLVSWSLIYAAKDVSIESILDLEGKTIAVLKGSVNVEGLGGIKELVNAFDISCSYLELDSYMEAFEAVDRGQAHAVVVNKDFGHSHAGDYNIEMTGIIFQPSQIYFAFNKDAALTPLLIETIDSYIAGFKADPNSLYYNALEKWLSVKALEKAIIPVWLWWVVGISIAVICILIAGAFILNLMVKQRTRELRGEFDKQIQTEKKYTALVEQSNDGIIVIQDGIVKFGNGVITNMTGFSIEEITGRALIDFISPRYKELVSRRYADRMAGEDIPSKYEIEINCKDGKVLAVEINSSIIEYEGRPADMVIVRDITERKKAEETLADEATWRRILVEQSRDGIVILDQDGKVYESNKRFTEMIGYSDEEVKELHVWDWEAVASREQLLGMLSTIDEKGDHFETKHRRKDGSIYDVEISTNAALFAGQKLIFCVCRDITERKKAQDELMHEKDYVKSILDTVPVIIVALDTEGQIIDFNHYMEIVSGYSISEVKGKDWLLYFVPEREHERVRDDMVKAASGIDTIGFINPILTKSGQVRLIEWYSTVLRDKDGNITTLLAIGQDVTERLKAEQALADEAIRRRILIEKSRDGIVILDQDGAVYEANQRFAEMLGYTREEVENLHIWDWDVSIPRERLLAMLKSIDEKGEHPGVEEFPTMDYFETRHRRKDGSFFDVEINSNAAIIAGQKLIFSINRDITERKKAEEIIRISEEKYRTLFETMQQGVIFWDKNGKLVSANSATEKILGLTLAQMQGKTPEEVIPDAIHEDGSPFPKDTYPSCVAVKSGKPVKDVLMGIFNPRENEYRWVVVNAMPQFRENEKEPYQVYTIFNDITQIKEIERALIQSESNLRQSLNSWETTFNSIKNAICLLAPDDTIVRCNQAMIDIFGKHGKELTGKNIFRLIHGSEKHLEESRHFRMMRSGRREAGEISVGDKWYFIVIDPIFDNEGNLVGSVHTMDDITERKTMEERMIMTDRLASIGELSSGIAHEVNNPLTSVIGIIQLLMARGDIPDDILNDLQLINDEAQRASKVARNLLVFARKHANELQFASVVQAVEKVLELRAYDQKNNNIQVIRDFATDLPAIEMDYFQIQQVFLNIIINAEYAMKEAHNGGTLTIKTEKVGEMVRISFTDDGPGIPKENLKRIFDPFFTTKELGKGTGLGLSICHGIISQHHGNIYVKSELGKGAKFVIELPLDQPEEAEEGNDGEKQ
jgi:two-component system NtrC family sensor kinase